MPTGTPRTSRLWLRTSASAGATSLRATADELNARGMLTRLANGTWEPGKVVQIGLENPEAVSLALSPEVPGKVVEQVEALRDKIVSGDIEVSTEFEGEELQF